MVSVVLYYLVYFTKLFSTSCAYQYLPGKIEFPLPGILSPFTFQTPPTFSRSNLWAFFSWTLTHPRATTQEELENVTPTPDCVHISLRALLVFADMAFSSQDWGLLKDKSFILFDFVSSVPGAVLSIRMLNKWSSNFLSIVRSSKSSTKGFPGDTVVKNPPANARDTGPSPGPGRSHMPHSD